MILAIIVSSLYLFSIMDSIPARITERFNQFCKPTRDYSKLTSCARHNCYLKIPQFYSVLWQSQNITQLFLPLYFPVVCGLPEIHRLTYFLYTLIYSINYSDFDYHNTAYHLPPKPFFVRSCLICVRVCVCVISLRVPELEIASAS